MVNDSLTIIASLNIISQVSLSIKMGDAVFTKFFIR